MAQEIVMEFNTNGTVKIEGVGFVGADCEKATKPFEQVLGKTTSKTKKPEYNRQSVTPNRLKA